MSTEEDIKAIEEGQVEFKTAIATISAVQTGMARNLEELVSHSRTQNNRLNNLERSDYRRSAWQDILGRIIGPAIIASIALGGLVVAIVQLILG